MVVALVSKENKIVTTTDIVKKKKLVVQFSIINIQLSLLPWLHLKPAFLPEAEEPVVLLSY
jgi:hypothetical protein